MPFPTTERIKGRKVFPTCKGVRTQWDKISLKYSVAVDNPQSAHATFKEKVLDITDASATISGFLGKSNNIANLPKLKQEITDLSFKIADVEGIPAELLDALLSGKWRVVSTDYDYGKDSAKWSFNIEAGFIDEDESDGDDDTP